VLLQYLIEGLLDRVNNLGIFRLDLGRKRAMTLAASIDQQLRKVPLDLAGEFPPLGWVVRKRTGGC